ncbi:MAG: type II toxin-antitoxin system VapC family toxin [Terriglobales bacterium]|jgi:PIN domain nuclease of toxin-antitoxin system
MKAILDTHTFLWGIAGDRRMSQKARDLFAGPSDLVLSVASLWEILIKVQLRKLTLPEPAGSYLIRKLADNRVETLFIELNHLLTFEGLSLHHRDPFDRMLIAQAIEEDLPIVTADPFFSRYPVKVIW